MNHLLFLKEFRFFQIIFPANQSTHIFWRILMTATQLDRLKQDVTELEKYAKILRKKGLLERASKILEKRDFIDRRIAAA